MGNEIRLDLGNPSHNTDLESLLSTDGINPHIDRLSSLVVPGMGVQASTDILFSGKIFGRDSLKIAKDILIFYPHIVRDVIRTLGAFQGIVFHTDFPSRFGSGEEPGRIHHEAVMRWLGDKENSPENIRTIQMLKSLFGGTDDGYINYWSRDATPNYVNLVHAYCKRYGEDILDIEYPRQVIIPDELKGVISKTCTVRGAVYAALDALERDILRFNTGFNEYMRTYSYGMENPVMADSGMAYVHPNGKLINHTAPVAYLDLQIYTLDALIAGAELIESAHPEKAKRYRSLARELQEKILSELWMEGIGYFAVGMDRDENGRKRLIETLGIQSVVVPGSRLLDNNPSLKPTTDDDREKYIGGIANMVFSPEFLTDVGFRARGAQYCDIYDYPDYWGSRAAWVVMAGIAADGFTKHGLSWAVQQIDTGLVNTQRITGKAFEFIHLSPEGNPYYFVHRRSDLGEVPSDAIIVRATNVPEGNQGWSITAYLLAWYRSQCGGYPEILRDSWQYRVLQPILKDAPHVYLLSPDEIKAKQENHPFVVVDIEAGQKAEERERERQKQLRYMPITI